MTGSPGADDRPTERATVGRAVVGRLLDGCWTAAGRTTVGPAIDSLRA
ncbi:hypothetical protein ACFVFH_33040 [Streptomyces sp. NPDC057697]